MNKQQCLDNGQLYFVNCEFLLLQQDVCNIVKAITLVVNLSLPLYRITLVENKAQQTQKLRLMPKCPQSMCKKFPPMKLISMKS